MLRIFPKWMVSKVVVGAFLASAASAGAEVIRYDITSTNVVNCSTGGGAAPHGLWTNTVRPGGGACDNYFDIQAGSYLEIMVDTTDPSLTTGRLVGSAVNPSDYVAAFDIALSGFEEVYTYKQEGGPAYDPLTDTPDVDFFTQGDGSITITDDLGGLFANYIFNGFAGGFGFQYGTGDTGANAKDSELGASAWIFVEGVGSHWDFNLNTIRVPEPTTFALLAMGLLGIGFVGRRRKALVPTT